MGLVETPFKLSKEEVLCSTAITLCLNALSKEGISDLLLEQMCSKLQYGFTASASSIPCGPHFVRITDIKEGKIDWNTVPYCECTDPETYQLYDNDILIARAGSIGKSFIVNDISTEAVFASYMIRLRIKQPLNPNYIYWCLQSQQFWAQIMKAQRGSAMKNINAKMISSLKFPVPSLEMQTSISIFLDSFQKYLRGSEKVLPVLPHPLEEQRRIVARIEELTAKIEEARGLRRNQQQETEFLLESILKYTCINQMQGLACKKKLGDITTITSGGTPSRAMDSYWNGDIPWIKTGELLDGDIYQSEECLSKEGLENSSAKLFPPGTILIALYGQGQTRGRTGRLMVAASTNQACCAILPNPSLLNERFTQYWLRGLYTHMRETAHGGAQPNWNSQTIKNIVIALPSLAEQESTISYFDSIQKQINLLKHKQAEATAELDALLPSILDKAFKGEL